MDNNEDSTSSVRLILDKGMKAYAVKGDDLVPFEVGEDITVRSMAPYGEVPGDWCGFVDEAGNEYRMRFEDFWGPNFRFDYED